MLELIDYLPEHAIEIDGIGAVDAEIKDKAELPMGWADLLSNSLVAKTAVFDGRVIGCCWLATTVVGFTFVCGIFIFGILALFLCCQSRRKTLCCSAE